MINLSADDIIKIIETIPKYIQYFYPGYITIYVYYFIKAKCVPDTKVIFFKALMFSYIYVISIDRANIQSELFKNFLLVILSVLVAYFGSLIIKSELTSDILKTLGIETTFWDNEIEALQGIDVGAWLVVYLSNSDIVYEGWLHNKEMEQDRRRYISLTNFRKYLLSKDTGKPIEPYIEIHDQDIEEEVIIFYDDIERIEKRKIEPSD